MLKLLDPQSSTEHIVGEVNTTWMNVTINFWRRGNCTLVSRYMPLRKGSHQVLESCCAHKYEAACFTSLRICVPLFECFCYSTPVDGPRNLCFDKPVYYIRGYNWWCLSFFNFDLQFKDCFFSLLTAWNMREESGAVVARKKSPGTSCGLRTDADNSLLKYGEDCLITVRTG